ncbi:MAG: hypothetical protein PVI50_07725 [Gammaproteobacteria bacterium]|jgi:hypothetical protein
MDRAADTLMRGLGFLLGVGLTVALFLLVVEGVGRPVAVAVPPAATDSNGGAADPSGAFAPEVAAPAPASESLPEGDTDEMPGEDREAAAAPTAEDEPPQPAVQPRKSGFGRPSTATLPRDLPEHPVAARYLFWSPFRSEWAARGFATRLTSATAVPVEVIEEGRGEYRVGFDYRDEAQRQERIARIQTITGLELE